MIGRTHEPQTECRPLNPPEAATKIAARAGGTACHPGVSARLVQGWPRVTVLNEHPGGDTRDEGGKNCCIIHT